MYILILSEVAKCDYVASIFTCHLFLEIRMSHLRVVTAWWTGLPLMQMSLCCRCLLLLPWNAECAASSDLWTHFQKAMEGDQIQYATMTLLPIFHFMPTFWSPSSSALQRGELCRRLPLRAQMACVTVKMQIFFARSTCLPLSPPQPQFAHHHHHISGEEGRGGGDLIIVMFGLPASQLFPLSLGLGSSGERA